MRTSVIICPVWQPDGGSGVPYWFCRRFFYGVGLPDGALRVFSWIVLAKRSRRRRALHPARLFLFVFGFTGFESIVIVKQDRSRSVVQVYSVWHDADG